MPFDNIIARSEGTDPLVPEPMVAEIIQEMPTQSATLALARRTTMAAKTTRMPVLDVLPTAYWVGGDTGLKQTTNQEWKNVNLVAEEMATIVPIPDAFAADASIDLWGEVRPRLVEAMGRLLDLACIFGIGKPESWTSPAILPGAIAADNVVMLGTGEDLGVDTTLLGEKVALDGYDVNGFAARPGQKWRLLGLRSQDGIPIYQTNLAGPITTGLYGYPLPEVNNGSWQAAQAELIGGDWSKAIAAIRSDISFRIFEEGVISDDDGKVILNLMQQDSKAMRVTMRVAFATARPVTPLNSDEETRFPFGAIIPAGGS